MKPVAAFFGLSALAASMCLADVHWTFHPSVHGVDGPSAPYVTSELGANEISYIPPLKWTVSGTKFIPPGKIEADAFIDVVPIGAPSAWTPDRSRELHSAVLGQMVPSGASKATVVSEGVLPFEMEGGSPYEICFSYNRYAQSYMESVVFVEHGKTQFQIHLGCLKDDFALLHPAFVSSLFSLQVL
jgi:hypothetical protein